MIDEAKRQKTLDEYLGNKRNDKISHEGLPSCTHCGRIDPFIHTCKYCGLKFCLEHRLSENHACKGLHLAKPPIELRGFPAHELGHNLNLDVDVGLPDLRDMEKIPKLLFPFNEHYLMFAVAEDLEKKGINAILEYGIRVRKKVPVRIGGIAYPERGFKWRTVTKRPDIFLPDYGFFIEVENFYNQDLLKHFQDYSTCLKIKGYNGCVLTWKNKNLPKSPDIYLVDPLTGNSTIRVNPGRSVKTVPDRGPYPPGKDHTWIQYELFRWERCLEKLCSLEIPVAMSGHIFLPDEIEISKDGIVGWKPENFTQFSGWTHRGNNSSVPPEVPIYVDLCSYDGTEISCFEVKTSEDFKNEEERKSIRDQLSDRMKTRLFDRVWLVTDYHFLKYLWDKTSEFFLNEVIPNPEIGILGYVPLRGVFKVIKEAENLSVEKRELMSIKILK